ncbi:hypothetical protein GO755_24800 [Spirosoma sp. HMF4905]|uniref:Uncharacterized protein n=1 Tax=Spirosoma arboris TaxID=2682092 RepID=A0A7K1SHP6_9BACT|nr:hypothetical protein [Spirosoma arboris]MVM33283.1 hypothetical protein [Spirosoma arboris]
MNLQTLRPFVVASVWLLLAAGSVRWAVYRVATRRGSGLQTIINHGSTSTALDPYVVSHSNLSRATIIRLASPAR